MRGALARISSGVSSSTPSGAAGIPGVVGALEWHPAQRRATIRRTSANETWPPTVANAGPDRGAVTSASATSASAAAGRIHTFLWPWFRRLNQWRVATPMTASPARMAQLSRSEEHTSELQSLAYLACRLLLEKKNRNTTAPIARIRIASPDIEHSTPRTLP